MSHANGNTEDHLRKSLEWAEAYIRRNPKATVVQVARAANNARMTIAPGLVADVRRRVEAARINESMAKVVRPTPIILPPQPPRPPPATAAPTWVPAVGGAPFNPVFRSEPTVNNKPLVAIAPPLPPPPPPPPPQEDQERDEDEDEERTEGGTRRTGVRRKVMQAIPLDTGRNSSKGGGSVVHVLECGHAIAGYASQKSPTRICTLCGRSAEDQKLNAALKQLVQKHGFDYVLEQLTQMEKDSNA